MLKLRYTFRLIAAFIGRFKGVILLGILLGIVAFLIFRFVTPILLGSKQEKIGITGRFHVDELPQEILLQVGEGLTAVSDSGEVEPALAQRWETPDRGKTWVFYLNNDKFWQDGKKVNASSIKYNFEDVTIETPDESTIKFSLKTPLSSFPSVVTRPIFKKGLLGTGQWRVEKLSVAGTFVERLDMRNKKGERKVYKFYPTQERTKVAFKLGEVDVVEDLVDPTPFKDWSTVNIVESVNRNRHVSIFFNMDDPLFKDNKPLRQALAYAINKEDFGGQRALGPISPDSWAYNPQIKTYDYDANRAKELISQLPKEVRGTLEVNLMTTPVLLSVAEKIAEDWQKIGVKTNVKVTSATPSEFQVFLVIYDTPLDPDQYSTWHSTQVSTNISNFRNPRIDKLLEDGRIELNLEERKKIYLDFQRFLVEETPVIFLYHPTSYKISRK